MVDRTRDLGISLGSSVGLGLVGVMEEMVGATMEEVAVSKVQKEIGGQAKTIEQVVSLGGTKKAIVEERKKKKKRQCRGKTKGTAFKVF